MSVVCHDVKIEPALQPLTGEALRYTAAVCEDDAYLDIRAAGFWGTHHQHAFLISVFFKFLCPIQQIFNAECCLPQTRTGKVLCI